VPQAGKEDCVKIIPMIVLKCHVCLELNVQILSMISSVVVQKVSQGKDVKLRLIYAEIVPV